MPNASHIVQRRIDVLVTDAEQLAQVVTQCDGVESAQSVGHGVRVRYDALRWDYEALERALEAAGTPVRRGWRHAIKVALFEFLDRNVRSHARSQGSACCSRPAGIYGGQDRPRSTKNQ